MATSAITGSILDLTGDPHATSPVGVRLWLQSSEDFIGTGASARTGGMQPIAVAADGSVNHDGIPETIAGAPLYRLHVDSAHLRAAGRESGVTSGWFALPAGGITLGEIAETYFAPTLVEPGMYTSVVELVAAAQAAADQAEAAADTATAISGLTGEDDAVALLASTPGTDTHTALSATYVAQEQVTPKPHADTEFFGGDATPGGYIEVYSQIGTGAAGLHDLAFVVGGMADIAFRHHPGGSGKMMFEMTGKVPSQMVNGWEIHQGDNSPVVTFPSAGGEVKWQGVLRGDNGANKDLQLKMGSATGSVIIKNSAGTTRLAVATSGIASIILASAGAGVQVFLGAESVPRAVLADDRLRFGSGAAIDINLFRAAAGVLRTDSRLDLAGKDLLVQQGTAGVEGMVGAKASRLYVGLNATNQGIYWCTGTPEGSVTAPVGSMALRSDGGAGTTLYVKETGTGNTGWAAK